METRQIPSLQMRAAFVPATLDETARTVELIWSTGAQVVRTDWWNDTTWIEDLSMLPQHIRMDRINSGTAPLLSNHDACDLDSVLGVVNKAWIVGDQGHAMVQFSERDDVQPIFNDVKAGILRNISVGYKVYSMERQPDLQDGLPVFLIIDWEPYEISIVPVNADLGAQTRSRTEPTNSVTITEKVRTMPEQQENQQAGAPETSPAGDPKSTDFVAVNEVMVKLRALGITDPKPSDHVAIAKTERERITNIRNFGRMSRVSEAVIADLIERGISAEDAKAIMIEKWSAQVDSETTRSDASVTTDARDKFIEQGVQALLARAGKIKIDEGNELRGLRMTEFAKLCLERSGTPYKGMSELQMVGRAFSTSTSDFPVLLENAMHKTLQDAYGITPDTWSRFCSIGSVNDFRAHNRYRLGSLGVLDLLNELGEFKNKTIPDGEKASITAGTKGNIINISRQTIINDDMGAFLTLASMMGRAARRTIETDVYALLASNPTMNDGIALFHASHGNLAATGSVTSVASIDAARVAMSLQTDVSGNDYLDLDPVIWLGNKAAGGTAKVVNRSEFDPDTANKINRPNMVRDQFTDIIATQRISGTTWYAFASPMEAPVIEVAFLNGEQAPFIEWEPGFQMDGMKGKVRLDVGYAAIDWRGGYMNPGA